ncbi:hypothetical protein IKP85_03415 [bacterium]|nr:hypothetical protein [bacterium]
MGYIKKIFRAAILALAIIGFLSIGGKDWVVSTWNKYVQKSPQSVMEKAQKIGDFSQINEEFTIEKASGMLGYNGVLAEHKASGQKMIVVDDNKKPLLTRKDIETGEVEQKLKSTLGKVKYQSIGLEEFEIIKHGSLYTYGQNVPYARFNAKISRFPVGAMSGVVAVASTKDGEDRLIISVNEKAKYSQLLAEEFFKKIK